MTEALSPAPANATARVPPPSRKRPWLVWGCGGLIALLLLTIAVLLFLLWWAQRPITPVKLSPAEKEVVEGKLRQIGDGAARAEAGDANAPAAGGDARVPTLPGDNIPAQEPDRPYLAGSKVLKLTEREINGLLNENTDLGQKLRLEFGRDAVNAYLAVPIPKDFPVGGGRMFRARGRFRVALGQEGKPFAVLEDITVLGLSLPKAWLGGIKGENLLDNIATNRDGSPVLRGIKSLRVEPGALVLEVED